MRRPSSLMLLALAALVLSGCGDSDGGQVRRTADQFTAALVRGDGTAACERLAEAGVSELLLIALRAEVPATALDEPAVDHCAVIAERLAADANGLADLQDVPVTRTLLEGDVATVETHAGSYELEEINGRWRLTRFDPVATVLAGRPAPVRPVSVTIARPQLADPALGSALAGTTRKKTVELTASMEPKDARVQIAPSTGTRVRRLEARDGRVRAELELQRGRNEVLLSASTPGRASTELAVRITRE